MNNMYDILGKMNLLEGRGSKPDFLDLDKDGNKTEPMKSAAKEVDEASYSAKAARAGKDIGKPGKAFAQIAKSAGERYGSKERGEKVAGAVLAKLRKTNEDDMEEGNRFTGNLVKARAAGKKMADLDGDGDMEPVREYEFDDRDDFDRRAKSGDTVKTTKGTLKKTDRGVQHTRRHDDDNTGSDDDYDEHGNLKPGRKDPSAEKRGRGRPKGTKHAIGAKGPTGKSKLLKKGAIKEGDIDGISLVDKGEYDREGDMAREQLHTVIDAAKELHSILDADENLPEWVQSKITKALDYLDTARDYVKASDAEDAEEVMPERKLSKPEMNKREKFVKSMKKSKGDFGKRYGERGEEVMYATATKMAKKKGKEETEESTVAGSVATAPATGKGKKGMIFGKGVYESQITESYNRRLSEVLTEGMSINMSVGENGEKNLSVTASDDDAVKLAQILKLAGMGSAGGYEETCPACGATPCGCEQMAEGQEDVANAPEAETQTADYMTKTIAGGLNKQKRDIAGDGQTTVPVTAVRVQEAEELESHLTKLYQQYKA
jgi:hypothetical protein